MNKIIISVLIAIFVLSLMPSVMAEITELTLDKDEYYLDEIITISGISDGDVEDLIFNIRGNSVQYVVIYDVEGAFSHTFTMISVAANTGEKTLRASWVEAPIIKFYYYDYPRPEPTPTVTSLSTDEIEYYLDEIVTISGTTNGYVDGDDVYLQIDNDNSQSFPNLVIPISNDAFSDSVTLSDNILEGVVTISHGNSNLSIIETEFYYYDYPDPTTAPTDEQIAFDNAVIDLNDADDASKNADDALTDAYDASKNADDALTDAYDAFVAALLALNNSQ